jgi:hypothetical protein
MVGSLSSIQSDHRSEMKGKGAGNELMLKRETERSSRSYFFISAAL